MSQFKQAAPDRNGYKNLVLHYLEIRKNLRAKYKFSDPIYKKRAKLINYRIGVYRAAIKRIEDKMRTVNLVNDAVKINYGVSLFHINSKWPGSDQYRHNIKRMFCKYCMELGISGKHISFFMSMGYKMPSEYRRQINKTMQSSTEAMDEWHKFKKLVSSFEEVGNMSPDEIDFLFRKNKLILNAKYSREKQGKVASPSGHTNDNGFLKRA
jgi:hypothetical protein